MVRQGVGIHSFPYCILLVRDSGWVQSPGIFRFLTIDEYKEFDYGVKTSRTNIYNIYDKFDVLTWAVQEHHKGTLPAIIAQYIKHNGATMYGHHPTDNPERINVFDVDYVITYDGELFDKIGKHLDEALEDDAGYPKHMGEYLKDKFGDEY